MQSQLQAYFPEDLGKKRCGCYIRRPDLVGIKFQKALVPLKHIDYQLQIVNSLLNITLTQKYFNPTEKFLEVDYSLPISPESSIYKFSTEFGNVKIEGIVKQKEQAKKQYEKAKSQGRQAVIGTIDPDSKDILNLEIGNIPPQTEFTIIISLLQEMKISLNTFYKLQIPSTISPRFMNKVQGVTKIPEHMQHKGKSSGKADYDWTFKIQLKTTRKVVFFDSPSHDIMMLSQNQNGTQTIFVMEKSQIPNKDFTFVYTTQNFHLPSYVLGKTDTSSTVMLSLIPKFCSLEISDAYRASVQNKPYETDMSAAKGDYVFFLDRSGSMGGTRIKKAKQALVLFLKSLPEDSYFNVISFGNGSERMFPKSHRNQSKAIQNAVNQVQKMDANMGGTQIYNPLDILLKQAVIEGYPRHIFLLTDGGVSNTQGVLNMVKKNTKHSRVHSIGIGNGASYDLIQGCAQNGKGKFVMISDDENPAEKIIELLETTLTPLISKVSLQCSDEKAIESIVPNPKSIPYILKDDIANFYITFPGPITQKKAFTFEYEDSVSKLPYKTQIQVEPTALSHPFVDKMAHLKVLRSLEASAKDGIAIQQQMHYVKVKNFKQEAVKYSVKHQILSEFTAFLCVGKQLVDGQYQQYKNKGVQKIHVEQTQPKQYDEEQQRKCRKQKNVRAKMSAPIQASKSKGGFGDMLGNVGSAISGFFSNPLNSKPRAMPEQSISSSLSSFSNSPATSNYYARQSQQQLYGKMQKKSEANIPQMIHPPPPPPPPPLAPSISIQKESRGMFDFSEMKKQQKMAQQLDLDCLMLQQNEHEQIQIKSVVKKKQKQDKKQSEQRRSTLAQKQKSEQSHKQKSLDINEVITMQAADGSWSNQKLIDKLAKNSKQLKQLCEIVSKDVVITKLVVLWLQKYYTQKQYALIIKKGLAWLKKIMQEKGIGEEVMQSVDCI